MRQLFAACWWQAELEVLSRSVLYYVEIDCREKRYIRSIVGRAGRRMMVHHIGTAILGSLVITVALIPRAIIGFFNNKY